MRLTSDNPSDSRSRDRKAREFEKYYRESYRRVYNYAYYRLYSHADAEDVTSEVFLKAAKAFDRFDPERASFSTWVLTIAHNCTVSFARSRKPLVLVGDDLERIDVNAANDEYPELDETSKLLSQMLDTLNDEERELVYLKYSEQMSYQEIGEALGINASTASTKVSRAIAKMRKNAPDNL